MLFDPGRVTGGCERPEEAAVLQGGCPISPPLDVPRAAMKPELREASQEPGLGSLQVGGSPDHPGSLGNCTAAESTHTEVDLMAGLCRGK